MTTKLNTINNSELLPPNKGQKPIQIVFLCGARDFHAMDWYRASLSNNIGPCPIIVTDLVEGEGYKKLITDDDSVYNLFLLDKFLLPYQSKLGNIWRNILKAIIFPLQVFLLKRFSSNHKNAIYYAHSMYYIWLAWASGVNFVGTPQGSDILLKPKKSRIYRILSTYAMRSALLITVDSVAMRETIRKFAGIEAFVIQNGIDIQKINCLKRSISKPLINRDYVISIRGYTPLYRIDKLVSARNCSRNNSDLGILFIYPFYEKNYLESVKLICSSKDNFLSRLSKDELYRKLLATKLAISIPISDSSPRSVYEAIFCGSIVAITYNSFYDFLPLCMKERLIIVNMDDPEWFDHAIATANSLIQIPFVPSDEAVELFDQLKSFHRVHVIALELLNNPNNNE